MGRLCGGAHEISGIPIPLWLCGWVVGGFLGWVGGGWVMAGGVGKWWWWLGGWVYFGGVGGVGGEGWG